MFAIRSLPPAPSRAARCVHRASPILALAGVVLLAGCVRREGRNTVCQWPDEAPAPLDLRNPAHRRHLGDDARFAEELAIRAADAPAAAGTTGTREERIAACSARLDAWIAMLHDVTPDDVRRARDERPIQVDVVVVFVPLGILLGTVAGLVGGREARRPGGWREQVRLLAMSVASAGIFMAVGEVWSRLVEMVRVGDSDLGARAARLPWNRHPASIFLGALLFFWAFAAWRARAGRSSPAD